MYLVDVMVHINRRKKNEDPSPCPYSEEQGEMEVIPMLLSTVFEISSVRIMLPENLTLLQTKTQIRTTMRQVLKQFNNQLPVLSPCKDMKIQNDNLDKLWAYREQLVKEIVQL